MLDWLIISGSYERLLYGVKLNGASMTLESEFIYPSHISCIKCVATGGRYLASGATDEHLKVYDLKLRKEVGTLMQHEGSVTNLEFYNKTHLVSSSEDGTLILYRVKDWEVLKTLRGHKGQVNHFALHPSGKILLSVGKDSTLRLWDLMRGLCVKTMKLKHAADKVIWSASGKRYATSADKHIIITDIDTGEDLYTWVSEQRIHSIAFAQVKDTSDEMVEILLAAGEDKLVHVINVDSKCYIKALDVDAQTRIKDFGVVIDNEEQLIVTCTSDGVINVASIVSILKSEEAVLKLGSVANFSTGCRLVCLKVVNLSAMGDTREKRKKVVEEIQSEVESEFENPKAERVTVTYEKEAETASGEPAKKSKKRKFNAKKNVK